MRYGPGHAAPSLDRLEDEARQLLASQIPIFDFKFQSLTTSSFVLGPWLGIAQCSSLILKCGHEQYPERVSP